MCEQADRVFASPRCMAQFSQKGKKKMKRKRLLTKGQIQFVWTKQANLFFTLTEKISYTVGCNDDMPRFTRLSVCSGYVIIIDYV